MTPPSVRQRVESGHSREVLKEAFELLGWAMSWKRGGEFIIHKGEQKLSLHTETVFLGLEYGVVESMPQEQLALLLADLLALSIPDGLTSSIHTCRAFLRPRLATPEDLEGPSRTMCRRAAWGTLSWGVSIGLRSRRSFVATRHLDSWGLEFEEVMLIATENLRGAFGPELVCEVSGVEGLLAVMHDREPAASTALLLDDLIPTPTPGHGHVFSTPNESTLLAMPVVEGAGADALASLVQGTYAVAAEQALTLSDQVFWRRAGRVSILPMTWVEEDGVRRVHLDAEGEISDLLRILGEIE